MRLALSFDIEEIGPDTLRLFARHPEPRTASLDVQCGFLLDELGEAQATATFFCLGASFQHRPDLLKRIHRAGHELAVHGWEHQRLDCLTPSRFRRATAEAAAVVEAATSAPVRGFRAPFLSLTPRTFWAIRVLKDLGFSYDSSFLPVPGRRLPAAWQPDVFRFDNGVWEIPVTVLPAWAGLVPAGGGYFRSLPYSCFRRMLNRHMSLRGRAVVYHHNYDFFESPLLSIKHCPALIGRNAGLWVRLFLGARSCGPAARQKLRQLLRGFRCCALRDLLPPDDAAGVASREGGRCAS